jgi:hypothetical protein
MELKRICLSDKIIKHQPATLSCCNALLRRSRGGSDYQYSIRISLFAITNALGIWVGGGGVNWKELVVA